MGDLRSIKAKLRGQPCGNNLKAMKSHKEHPLIFYAVIKTETVKSSQGLALNVAHSCTIFPCYLDMEIYTKTQSTITKMSSWAINYCKCPPNTELIQRVTDS